MEPRVLASMVTTTSYGTWLPGDARGYVADGEILPGAPKLLDRARSLLARAPVYFDDAEQDALLDALCNAAVEFGYRLTDVSVESWHLHGLIDLCLILFFLNFFLKIFHFLDQFFKILSGRNSEPFNYLFNLAVNFL